MAGLGDRPEALECRRPKRSEPVTTTFLISIFPSTSDVDTKQNLEKRIHETSPDDPGLSDKLLHIVGDILSSPERLSSKDTLLLAKQLFEKLGHQAAKFSMISTGFIKLFHHLLLRKCSHDGTMGLFQDLIDKTFEELYTDESRLRLMLEGYFYTVCEFNSQCLAEYLIDHDKGFIRPNAYIPIVYDASGVSDTTSLSVLYLAIKNHWAGIVNILLKREGASLDFPAYFDGTVASKSTRHLASSEMREQIEKTFPSSEKLYQLISRLRDALSQMQVKNRLLEEVNADRLADELVEEEAASAPKKKKKKAKASCDIGVDAKRIAELESEIAQLTNQLSELKSSSEKFSSEMESAILRLREENEVLRQQLAKETDRHESAMKKSREEYRRQLTTSKAVSETLNKKLSELEKPFSCDDLVERLKAIMLIPHPGHHGSLLKLLDFVLEHLVDASYLQKGVLASFSPKA